MENAWKISKLQTSESFMLTHLSHVLPSANFWLLKCDLNQNFYNMIYVMLLMLPNDLKLKNLKYSPTSTHLSDPSLFISHSYSCIL